MPRPDVVFLASYPKSGNTWLRALLANLHSGLDQPVNINTGLVCSDGYKERAAFDHVTLLESAMMTPGEIDHLQPAVFAELTRGLAQTAYVKIHDAYRRNKQGDAVVGAARAAVYIIRDPRDVAVSLSHHLGLSLDEAIAMLNSPEAALVGNPRKIRRQFRQPLLDWSGHVRSWITEKDLPVHVVRFEDLKRNTEAVFAGLARRLCLAPTAEEIRRAVRFSGFEELQRQERAAGFRERLHVATAPFFRQGEMGAWQRQLTEQQGAAIEAAHGVTMRQYGYDLTAPYQGQRDAGVSGAQRGYDVSCLPSHNTGRSG